MSESSKKADTPGMGRARGGGKGVILMMFLSVVALAVLFLFLFVKVYEQEQILARLAGQVEELKRIIQEGSGEAQGGLPGEADPGIGESQKEESDDSWKGQEEPQTGTGQEETEGDNLSGNGASETGGTGTVEEIAAAHKVYLTFDDGPSIYTYEILDILDAYDVKATFFVVGKDTEKDREAMKEIVARGHTLGMHSYSHKYSQMYASLEAFAEDFVRIRELIYEVTGEESHVYRFPGGSSNTVSNLDMWLFADYLEEQGVRFYDWNISSGDGGSQILPVETLVENCTNGILSRETNVVLMHDSAQKQTTVEALPAIIEAILAMEDTAILPITEGTVPVQHIHREE